MENTETSLSALPTQQKESLKSRTLNHAKMSFSFVSSVYINIFLSPLIMRLICRRKYVANLIVSYYTFIPYSEPRDTRTFSTVQPNLSRSIHQVVTELSISAIYIVPHLPFKADITRGKRDFHDNPIGKRTSRRTLQQNFRLNATVMPPLKDNACPLRACNDHTSSPETTLAARSSRAG